MTKTENFAASGMDADTRNISAVREKGKTMNNRPEKMGNGVRFERIRRITGYLVGTLERWNTAKQAEERDRVKHGERKDNGTTQV